MSLKEAVLDICEQMEEDAGAQFEGADLLKRYARSLRSVCKAAVEIPPVVTPITTQTPAFQSDPLSFHLQKIEEAKAEFRKNKKPLDHDEKQILGMDESVETQSYLCKGGPLDGEYIILPAALPIGAHPSGMREVYTLKADGQLHYDAELSARVLRENHPPG